MSVAGTSGQDLLSTSYVPYLPRLAIEWLAEHRGTPYQELDGTLVFVDISGFTKLSERLARLGKMGAEELTHAIDGCFTRLLAEAYADGGGLLKFGGDALLLLFSGAHHQLRGSRAAIGMRRALRQVGRLEAAGQPISLRMSVGVHSGVFQLFLVGESHRELVVTGPGASTTVLMESTADAGEVVVSEATAAALRPSVLGPVKGPGRLLRRAPTGPAWEGQLGGPVPEADIAPGIPAAVRSWLEAGVHQPEHRRVTVAFVHFDGIDAVISDHGTAEAARRLDLLVAGVQRAADHHGITFLGTDIDRDGGKIILAAGTPTSSGDDERRMLLTLREIVELDPGLPVRVGVNRGDVFTGGIGPPYRRTFTVMGDTVNLAARLMAKAEPGEILATEGVIARSPTAFETRALEPFFVKGKAKPVQAVVVGPRLEVRAAAAVPAVPLVGREAELATLLEALEAAREGKGSLIELVGEAGLGKSRLVEELCGRADDVLQLSMVCEPYASSTPYFAFRELGRTLLGLEPGAGGSEGERIRHMLARVDPDLVAWAPLIGTVVDVHLPDTPETAQLDVRFRPARLGALLVEVLTRLLTTPTLLTVEDAHWMDEASADLLKRLTADLDNRPWLICATRREQDSGFAGEGPRAVIRLGPLGAGEAVALLHLATEDAPIAPHEIAALAERSGGNPLFLRELIATARTAGEAASLPDTVEALITARIDLLSPHDRNLLRRASVLGRRFSPDLLAEVLDDVPGPDDEVWSRLAGLLGRDDTNSVVFDHALVRDSAYEGLPYRLRRDLHARAADAIRASTGSSGGDDQAELLSLHYLNAQRYHEAWSYSLVAAARATSIHAHVEAEQFYHRALEAARRLPDIGADEVARVHEELGDVRNRVGGYAGADAAYRAARRLMKADAVADARLILKLSRVQGWLDRYARALRWITQGLRRIEGVEGTDAAHQRAQLMACYGRFCQEEGRHTKAMYWCRLAIAEAGRAGDNDALADALSVLDWALMDLGRLDQPSNLSRALALYEGLGDLPGQASVLNMLGGIAYWRGEWDHALDLYERARDTVARTGDTVKHAFCANNIGEIALDQGKHDQAAELFTDASRVWQAAGYRSGVAFAKCNLARVATRRGDYIEALRLFEESLAEARDIGAQAEALETRARMAECLVMAGSAETALGVAQETIGEARALGGVAAQNPLLQRVRGAAFARLGRLAEAAEALEQSLAAARAREADYEVALTLRAKVELARREGRPVPKEAWSESQAILDRLGVVFVPDLLA